MVPLSLFLLNILCVPLGEIMALFFSNFSRKHHSGPVISMVPNDSKYVHSMYLLQKIENPLAHLEYLGLELILASVGINNKDLRVINPHFLKSIFCSHFF